jgi:hypothetical protein
VSPDEGHIAPDGELQDVGAAVDLAGLLALGQRRADAGGAEERTDAGTGRAHPFGEVALWHHLEVHPALTVQPVEHPRVRLPRERAHHATHAARCEQRGQSGVSVSRVVGDDGEVAGALPDQRVDQVDRHPGHAEAADQHGRTVLDTSDSLVGRLAHDHDAFSNTMASA